MKRPRPYIPMEVRIQVASRQLRASRATPEALLALTDSEFTFFTEALRDPPRKGITRKLQLEMLLEALDGFVKLEPDHDPALILREFKMDRRRPMAAWYTPNANDPAFLVYRPAATHQEKTTGRKPGAERTVTTKGSDIWLKSKFARLEKRTAKSRRPKAKIASRPFSSQKRSFR